MPTHKATGCQTVNAGHQSSDHAQQYTHKAALEQRLSHSVKALQTGNNSWHAVGIPAPNLHP